MAEIKNLTKKKESIYNTQDKINNNNVSNNIYINKNINIYNNKNIHIYNNEPNNYKVNYINSIHGTPRDVYTKNYISIINSESKNKMTNEKNEVNIFNGNIKNEKNKKGGSQEIRNGIEYINNNNNNIQEKKKSNNHSKISCYSNEYMIKNNEQIHMKNTTTINSYEYNNKNNIIKEGKKEKCYLLYNGNKNGPYYYMNEQNVIDNNNNNNIIKGGSIHNNDYYNIKPVNKYEHYSKYLAPVIINNNNNNNNNNIDCNCINIKNKINNKDLLKINNISVYDQKKNKIIINNIHNNNNIFSSDCIQTNNIYDPIQGKKYIASKKYMSPSIKNSHDNLKEKNKSYINNINTHLEYNTNSVIKNSNDINYNDTSNYYNNTNDYKVVYNNNNNNNNNNKYVAPIYKSSNNVNVDLKNATCDNQKKIQKLDKIYNDSENEKVYENIENDPKKKQKKKNIYKENMTSKKNEINNNVPQYCNNNNNYYTKEDNYRNIKNNVDEKNIFPYEKNNYDNDNILPKNNESTDVNNIHNNINNIYNIKNKSVERSSYINQNNLHIIKTYNEKINEVSPSDVINSNDDMESDHYESIPSQNVSLSKIADINIPQNNTTYNNVEEKEYEKYDSYNDKTNDIYSVDVMDNLYDCKHKNNIYDNINKDINNITTKEDYYINDVNDKNDNNKCNYYQKRGSISYSGLLTSMVSSILTQQNERKIKESNNCLNYSWGIDKYDYTLLQTFEDNTETKNNIILKKKIMEGFNKKKSNEHILTLTLSLMICISILCNYDHGAIPVTLEEIQKDFPLSYIEQSLLGSLVYFGLIIGTIMASVLFELLSAKLLVTISIILLSISLYIFSHANCITFMYISRFVNGLCQAIPVVYLPVWVDEFSPDEKATQWMSYIQLASIGGTVFGYFLGGILSNNSYTYHKNDSIFSNVNFVTTWRSPFLIQAFLLLPIFLIMIFIPSDKINITSNNTQCTDDISIQEIDDITQSQNKNHKQNNNITNKYSNHKYPNNIYNSNTYDNIYKTNNYINSYNNIYHNNNINICHNNETKDISYTSRATNKSIAEKHKYRKSKLFSDSKNKLLRRNFNRSATYIMEKKTNVLKKTLKEVKKLFHNKLYIIITLGMSNLYFVVTGIQFWITEYMSVVLLTEKMKIVTVSTLCFLTSPTSGVWFGGFVCDLFGGYKNTNYSKTIKVATAFAISACIFGILSAHLKNFIFFSISLWLCLFTGSALVPVCVGMLLSCVNNHQKSLSSAVSQVIYNVFGWFSAPLLSGIIMDIMHKYTNDNRLALKAGFTMILYSSSIGFLLLLYANFLDLSEKKDNDELIELEEPLT
ncbi:sugar transporter, putative [Plasmodium sp. DRC-Itaito]|nr:sugar transporter, putative [Plasmodium sp. DRC-Itaito]